MYVFVICLLKNILAVDFFHVYVSVELEMLHPNSCASFFASSKSKLQVAKDESK